MAKIALGATPAAPPDPICVQKSWYRKFGKFYEGWCLKNFCLAKYYADAILNNLKINNFWKFSWFLSFRGCFNKSKKCSTGRQFSCRPQIRNLRSILSILHIHYVPNRCFVRNLRSHQQSRKLVILIFADFWYFHWNCSFCTKWRIRSWISAS